MEEIGSAVISHEVGTKMISCGSLRGGFKGFGNLLEDAFGVNLGVFFEEVRDGRRYHVHGVS